MNEQIDPYLVHSFLNAVTLHRSGLQALQLVQLSAICLFILPELIRDALPRTIMKTTGHMRTLTVTIKQVLPLRIFQRLSKYDMFGFALFK